MKEVLNGLLVVDIACTCWEKPKDQPPGAKNEIIEIGVVPVVLKDLTIGEPISIFVKPQTSIVNSFCTKITTITQDMASSGMIFRDACKFLIEKLDTRKIPWVSWGNYDKKQFQYQCNEMKCHYPFGAGHWNFENMFTMMMGLQKEVGLKEAVKMTGLKFEGTYHRAGDNALNIAKIMVECYRRIRAGQIEEIIPEQKTFQDIMDRASEDVNKWPDWKRSPDVKKELANIGRKYKWEVRWDSGGCSADTLGIIEAANEEEAEEKMKQFEGGDPDVDQWLYLRKIEKQ
jgi:inhibitor of KinA sporulation pathway (predicted exonuclease)